MGRFRGWAEKGREEGFQIKILFNFLNSKQFQIRTKSSINMIQNTLFSSNINEPILGKFFENNFLNSFIFLIFFSFFSFISKPFLISFQEHFNHFDSSIKTTQPIESNGMACMLKHVATL